MKIIHILLFPILSLFLLGGCVTTKLDGLEVKTEADWKEKGDKTTGGACALGKPLTNQGISLCYALYVSDLYRDEIELQLRKTRIEPYDYSQIALAVLSAGALAASSHISVLETLGISVATAVGLKTYANVPGARSARQAAIEGLSCISAASGHLVWDDRWFFAMRSYRHALHSAVSDSAPYVMETKNSNRLKNYTTLKIAAINSISLADDALIQYAALGKRVSLQRSKTLTDMQDLIDSSRGDVSSIVNSIVAAKAIQLTSNQEVDKVAQDAATSAADATPTTPAAAGAQGSLEEGIEESSKPLNSNDQPAAPNMEVNDTNGVSNETDSQKYLDDIEASTMPRLVNEIVNKNYIDSTDKLDAYMGIMSSSIQGIATIAPRYIKATIDVAACVIK